MSDEVKKNKGTEEVKGQPTVAATDNVEVIVVPDEEEKVDNLIKLSRTYDFEGRHVSEIDLTKIENLNAMQMQGIENTYRRIAKNVSSTPELTIEYAMAAAATLTDLPIEFYKRINAKDITKIKNRVINFLYSED